MSTVTKIQAGIGHDHYTTKMTMRGHLLIADEPESNGGKDQGPTSTELIISGLAACITSTLRMYADRKGWEVERIDVEVSLQIERTGLGQTSNFDSTIAITGNLTQEQKDRMLVIAGKCPVHKLLTNSIQIKTHLKS
jgi:putative redox protein